MVRRGAQAGEVLPRQSGGAGAGQLGAGLQQHGLPVDGGQPALQRELPAACGISALYSTRR